MTEQTRVLLVEDDPNIVDLIRSNLAVRGFDTMVSSDGVRALALLESGRPDVVLLDLAQPRPLGLGGNQRLPALLQGGAHPLAGGIRCQAMAHFVGLGRLEPER